MPSVPSGRNGDRAAKRAICSGTLFMKSVTATIGPGRLGEQARPPASVRGGWSGCSRFHRSAARASSRSVLYDVADHSSTPTS